MSAGFCCCGHDFTLHGGGPFACNAEECSCTGYEEPNPPPLPRAVEVAGCEVPTVGGARCVLLGPTFACQVVSRYVPIVDRAAAPAWCPLRRAPLLVRLGSERHCACVGPHLVNCSATREGR